MKETLKVGVSGVRGVIGDSLTPQVALTFAQAFGTFVGHGPVVVGRDTRVSGPMIEQAVVAGLQSVGCRPVLAGIVPTPTVLMLTQDLGARGGIVITASHNPSPWNALKFVGSNGFFLNETRAQQLLDIYHQQSFPLSLEDELPASVVEPDPMKVHYKRVLDYVDADLIRKKKFKVAVDCCNGVGALHSAHFLRDLLGCEVVTVLDNPSGIFEREPEPLPKNLILLSDAVVRNKCDIGFAQDPDGDRLAIVNEKGQPIGEDQTLAFAVQQVLAHHNRGPVAVNLSTSKSVEFVANQLKCEVTRTKIGEINVSEAMAQIGAVAGGEGNGGVIIPEIHLCRDSYAGMALVLEMLAMSGQTVSQHRDQIPYYTMVKEKLRVRNEQIPGILRALRRDYAGQKMNFLDGVYVDYGDSWIHARRSNTEPVIRITSEAPDPKLAEKLAGELRARVEKAIQ